MVVAAGTWFYTRLLWESFPTFVVRMDNCDLLFCDFVRHYWRMGRSLLETREPAPGFLYSPFFALLMLPLGALAKSTAVAVWGVIQGLGLLALFVLPLLHRVTRRPWIFAAYAVAFAWSVPLYHNFKWGQLSVLLTALVLIALELERRGRSSLAGWILAFATALKGYVVVFVWVLLARRRGRGLLFFMAGVVLFAAVVPAIVLGPGDTFRFYEQVNARLAGAQTGFATNPNSQSFASVIARWGTDPHVDPPLPSTALRGLGYVLAAGNLALAWRWSRDGATSYGAASALLFLSLPLLLQTSWPHYFAYLPAVIALALARLRTDGVARWWRIGGTIWILACLASTTLPALHLSQHWYLYSRAGWLLAANLGLTAWFVADRFLPVREAAA